MRTRTERHYESRFPRKYKRVPGEGPVPARVMLIGERPGQIEAERGRPFCGPAGELMDTMLVAANLDRKQLYITNLVKTYRDYEKPTREEIIEASAELLDEIDACQPEIIALLGGYAVEHVLGRKPEMERTHGVPVQWTPEIVCLPVLHPAAGLYSPDSMPNILDDFLRLGQLVDGEIQVRRDEHPEPDYATWKGPFSVQTTCAIDTEGTRTVPWCLTWSTSPGTAQLVKRVPQGSEFAGHVYLHNSLHDLGVLRTMGIHLGESQYTDTMVLAYHLCVEPQGLKALAYRHCAAEQSDYQDIIHDASVLKAEEYMTQIASRVWPDPEPYMVLEKGLPKLKRPQNVQKRAVRALGDVASDKRDKDGEPVDLRERWRGWDDEIRWPVIEVLGEMPVATLDDVDPEVAERYACRDADLTLRIAPILEARVRDMGLVETVALDHAILPMVDRMQETGIRLADRPFWDRLEAECVAQMGRAKYAIYRETGAEINPASGDQVAALLYEQLGLTPPRMTESGSRGKVDGIALEGLLSAEPEKAAVVQHVMDYTEANKIRGTYVRPLRALAVQAPDKRAHATFRITRTTSGRLSMADPPLHQIPIMTELGRKVRGGFVAPEGRILGDWDVDQLEMRMCAHDSRDPELCRLFNEGRDIHTETAARIFSVSVNNIAGKSDTRRTVAKHAGFGVINGITEHGLLNYLILNRCKRPDGESWTLDDCVILIREWFAIYKGVKRFQDECVAEARETGLSRETVSGKIVYLPAVWSPIKWIRESAERVSYVMHTQGGGAAIVKRAMKQVWRDVCQDRNLLTDPLLWIHDELLMELPDEEPVKEVVDGLMLRALCETTRLRVPMKASGGYGRAWLEAH